MSTRSIVFLVASLVLVAAGIWLAASDVKKGGYEWFIVAFSVFLGVFNIRLALSTRPNKGA